MAAKRKEKIVEREPQYIILSNKGWLMLQDMVNFQIENGYQPIGGVSGLYFRDPSTSFVEPLFIQAMQKVSLIT